MNDHTSSATNETSEEMTVNGGNKPQVKRSSKLPVHISKAGGIRQPSKTSLKLPNHVGGCIRDQQSASANPGPSKSQISESSVPLARSRDKENSERPTMVIAENLQQRYISLN